MVLATMKHVVQKTNFFPMNYDEVTMINNQSWISIHVYVVEICNMSLNKVGLITSPLCWSILPLLLGDCMMWIGQQASLLWCGWCNDTSRVEDRGIQPLTFTMINQILTNGLHHQKVSNFCQVFFHMFFFISLQNYEVRCCRQIVR